MTDFQRKIKVEPILLHAISTLDLLPLHFGFTFKAFLLYFTFRATLFFDNRINSLTYKIQLYTL